jgi:hypothetical protein
LKETGAHGSIQKIKKLNALNLAWKHNSWDDYQKLHEFNNLTFNDTMYNIIDWHENNSNIHEHDYGVSSFEKWLEIPVFQIK